MLFPQVPHSLLRLQTPNSTFTLRWGSHFKQWSHQQKAQNAKNMPLNIRSRKGQLFTTGELKEGRTLLCSTSAGNVAVEQVNYFATLHMSTNDRESTVSIDLGLQMDFSEKAH